MEKSKLRQLCIYTLVLGGITLFSACDDGEDNDEETSAGDEEGGDEEGGDEEGGEEEGGEEEGGDEEGGEEEGGEEEGGDEEGGDEEGGDEEGGDEEGGDEEGGEEAETMIRVMHLGVGVPGVDVFANESEPAAVMDLGFREGTEYLTLPAAEYSFQVALTGGTPADAAITAGPLMLDADLHYTAVAVGDLEEESLEILPLVDDTAEIGDENIRLQVVHAAPAVGQVDIWNVAGEDSAELLADVDYKGAGTLDVPPAEYVLGVDVDDNAEPDLTFTVDLSGVPAGAFLNVFANNDTEGGVVLVALLEDGSVLEIPAD